jgi:hypothetical protein
MENNPVVQIELEKAAQPCSGAVRPGESFVKDVIRNGLQAVKDLARIGKDPRLDMPRRTTDLSRFAPDPSPG